ncbi:MAG: hypothetical protein HZB51_00305 [Chloroflexi bacterium]|nr:hypothetical protein [Chloroflexota bacterium]
MFVCMIQSQLPSQNFDQAIHLWSERVKPKLKKQKGWKNAAIAVSRDTGQLHIFTLWETKSQADGFESTDESLDELNQLLALGLCRATRVVYPIGDDEIIKLFGQASATYLN